VDINSPFVTQHPVVVPAENLPEWERRDGAYIMTTIPVKHLRETSRARNALAQLSTRMVGRINDSPFSNSFVVSDFAPVVCSMAKLLATMDADAAKARIDIPISQDPEIKSYEQKLAQCNTETAARYFVERIQALTAKKK
jgi:hypothetical protein